MAAIRQNRTNNITTRQKRTTIWQHDRRGLIICVLDQGMVNCLDPAAGSEAGTSGERGGGLALGPMLPGSCFNGSRAQGA